MSFFKDKTFLLILLTLFGLVYLMTTRGEWETSLGQDWVAEKNRVSLSENVMIESEHFISPDNLIVGSSTYFFVTSSCVSVDTISIRMFEIIDGQENELENTKRQVADMDKLVFDSQYNLSDESFMKSVKMEICPGQRIEISNWFKYTDPETKNFKIEYYIKDANQILLTKKVGLKKKSNFNIQGKHHYDFVILLYPVLWIILGILVIVKIVRIVRKK